MKEPGSNEAGKTQATKDRELFNLIAKNYCRKDILSVSRIARKQRLGRTFSVLPANPQARILEIGCGCGFSARYLEGTFAHYDGVDYAENLIRFAREHNSSEKAVFHATDIGDFAPDMKYDVIFMIGVLHHFSHLQVSFDHVVSLLKPGGWILANEPQPSNVLIKMARKIRQGMDPSYSSDQVTLSRKDLRDLYINSGLEQVSVVPQGLFSTPFAEVIVQPQKLFLPIAYFSVLVDRFMERVFGRLLTPFSWNLIAAGSRAPASDHGE